MKINEQPIKRRRFTRYVLSLGAGFSLAGRSLSGLATEDQPDRITAMSATQLSRAIRTRQVSCTEVMKAYLARIHRYNPTYNAIVSLQPEESLLAQAREADKALDNNEYRGWMHGMPHAVKDLANARGLPTSRGSRIFAGQTATADDLHVARIRSAGAIFIGKTNVPEFGLGSQTYNSVFGPTRNAYDITLTAGGSSGGAACGLATEMLPVADGSDMMGSLRNPAGFNNVIGFRPSQGRVPRVPNSDIFYGQLPVVGPMGRNVEDTIRLLLTMSGYDRRAPLSLRDELPPFDHFRGVDLSGYKIGWMGDYDGYLATEPGVLALCEKSLEEIAAAGASVEDCMPGYDMHRLWQTWLTLRHWALSHAAELYRNPQTRELLKPEVIWEIKGGLELTSARITEATLARADWYKALNTLFDRYDILALPTAQVFPFPVTTHWPDSINGRKMDTYHRWMEVVIGGTLAGVPVVNLPAGFDERGRPMGMQFLGRAGEDRRVLEFALAYQAATEHLQYSPDLTAHQAMP